MPARRRPRPINRNVNPIDPAGEFPSAHGQAGGPSGPGAGAMSAWQDNPDRKLGLPPKRNQAAQGGPSMSADVNASEIMQNMVMNDDDKRWYKKLFKKQARDFLKPRFSVTHGFDVGLNCGPDPEMILPEERMRCLGCATNLCRSHVNEAKKRDLLMEPDDMDRKKKQQKQEVNAMAGGAVRGSTATLRSRKKNAKLNARAFGGGQVVGKY